MKLPHRIPGELNLLDQDVQIDSGAVLRMEGYRYMMQGTVVSVNEEREMLFVKGQGFAEWFPKAQVVYLIPPLLQMYQGIMDAAYDKKR